MQGQDRRLGDADDSILAQRAADGDLVAFEVLVRRHRPLVRAYCRRILGSDTDVDDVTQEAFLAAWQHLPQLETTTSVRGWLFRIASRKCFDSIRSRRGHDDLAETVVTADTAAGPEARAEAHSLGSAMTAALDDLKPDQRQAWVLREIGGYSYEEIGAEMRLPVTTIRGLISRARAGMAARMEAWR